MNIIGLDIGTTSLCGILCNADSGEIVRSITRPNDAFLPTEHEWEKLQDPYILIENLKKILAELLHDCADVISIGITGQMHGIVYLNATGTPVSPLAIWQDGRGNLPYKDGKTYADWLSGETGYPLATGYGAVTHFYNTLNGLIPTDAVTFCTIHDLAVMSLTNRRTPLLNPSDAASFGLYDLKNNCFDAYAIAKAGMDPSFFPSVTDGYALGGYTAENVPVSVAIGDNQASVLGSVSDLEHSILVNVGTGSQISCVVTTLPNTSNIDCRPLIDGSYLLVGSSLCGGRAYAILEHFLRDATAKITGQPITSAYPAMDMLMADFCPSENTLVVDTAFSGTRQHPDKRGYIGNIGIDNLTMANLCDGVMNGMVKELHDLYSQMQPLLSEKPIKLVGSGNGIRFNAPLAARFSKAFGLPIRTPAHKEEAAFGAALFGMVAAGACPNIETAQRLIHYCE